MKARQSSKIRELAEAVESAGFLTLDEQARALGVPRSTAWTIRRASHKASGLTASIINRMLTAPQLPPLVRSKILEYVEEKAAGFYGGSQNQLRNFVARLSIKQLPPYRETEAKFPEAKRHGPNELREIAGDGQARKATGLPREPLYGSLGRTEILAGQTPNLGQFVTVNQTSYQRCQCSRGLTSGPAFKECCVCGLQ